MIRKTYLVTVDTSAYVCTQEDDGVMLFKDAITEGLSGAQQLRFWNPEVRVAPPTVQPLSNIEVRKNK